jgi:hypothetical protein
MPFTDSTLLTHQKKNPNSYIWGRICTAPLKQEVKCPETNYNSANSECNKNRGEWCIHPCVVEVDTTIRFLCTNRYLTKGTRLGLSLNSSELYKDEHK